MKVLVTGTAGFIGSHLAIRLLERGDEVVGFDNMSDYYDVNLKKARLDRFMDDPNNTHIEADLADCVAVEAAFAAHKPQRVVNLAAQAGSLCGRKPARVRQQQRHRLPAHIGGLPPPWRGAPSVRVHQFGVRHQSQDAIPRAPAARATADASCSQEKNAEEDSAQLREPLRHSVYRAAVLHGLWRMGPPRHGAVPVHQGDPGGQPIKVFNHGKHKRSFTYVDDIVEGVIRTLDQPATANSEWEGMASDPATSNAQYRIFNIGSERPVELLRYIEVLAHRLGKKAAMEMLPLQAGDVPDTEADLSVLIESVGYRPIVWVEEGMRNFVRWYRDHYQVVET